MKYLPVLFLFIYITAWSQPIADEIYTFSNEKDKQLYLTLLQETRCIVCKTQNIADSNAPFSNDVRHKIYSLIQQKKTKEEINNYLIKRYGDFILLNPPLKSSTWLLWSFPFFVFVILSIIFSRTFLIKKN